MGKRCTVLYFLWDKKCWVQAVRQGKFKLAIRKTLLTVMQSSSRLSREAVSLESRESGLINASREWFK